MSVTNYYTIDGQMIGYDDGVQKDFLTDALGSVTAEVDQTCTKTFEGRYKPYGGDLASSGTRGKYGWIGSWGYRETGLSGSSHYVRARHYSKVSANWTSIDPIWPPELPYQYSSCRVTFRTDQSGLGGIEGCSGSDPISKRVSATFAKFCRLVGKPEFLDCVRKNCDVDGGEPFDAKCFALLCQSGGSTYVKCEDCKTKSVPCVQYCGDPTMSADMPVCGSTKCRATMPRHITVCLNATAANLESQCCCNSGSASDPCEPKRSGLPGSETLLHEIRHACTPNCMRDSTTDLVRKNNIWAACVARCMKRFV